MKLVLVICLLVALPAIAADNELSGAPAKSASAPEPDTHVQASSVPAGNTTIKKGSDTTVNQPPATVRPGEPPSCTDRSNGRFKRSLVRALAELARAAARQ